MKGNTAQCKQTLPWLLCWLYRSGHLIMQWKGGTPRVLLWGQAAYNLAYDGFFHAGRKGLGEARQQVHVRHLPERPAAMSRLISV